jgi:hypothetical protein
MSVNYNSKFDLVFLTTFIDFSHVYTLIESVNNLEKEGEFLFIFVNQTDDKLDDAVCNFNHIEISSSRIGLSSARNLGIEFILNNNIIFNHIMFPDDDTVFEKDFIRKFAEIDFNKNYIIDTFILNSVDFYKVINKENGEHLGVENYQVAMSVNMIISYSSFLMVKYFDKQLGAGGKFGAGEDLDYYFRVCYLCGGFYYNNILFTRHPSPNSTYSNMSFNNLIKRFINYGNGTIFAFCKNRHYFNALICCIRAIFGGVYYLLKLDLRLSFAYLVAFFSRAIMFLSCVFFMKYTNNH